VSEFRWRGVIGCKYGSSEIADAEERDG